MTVMMFFSVVFILLEAKKARSFFFFAVSFFFLCVRLAICTPHAESAFLLALVVMWCVPRREGKECLVRRRSKCICGQLLQLKCTSRIMFCYLLVLGTCVLYKLRVSIPYPLVVATLLTAGSIVRLRAAYLHKSAAVSEFFFYFGL